MTTDLAGTGSLTPASRRAGLAGQRCLAHEAGRPVDSGSAAGPARLATHEM